jgi:hypothetical protein
MRTWILAVSVAAVSLGVTAPAQANTECVFGGPTPGYRAVLLDLPSGSDFLTLELSGTRAIRPVSEDDNWHLAQGIIVANADSVVAGVPRIEAYRVESAGMWPRKAIARTAGIDLAEQTVPTPEVPYVHESAQLREGLPAGSYLIFAFGTDGGPALPDEWWTAGIQVEGAHTCTPLGDLGNEETFDYDHTDFSGGTQVYAPGIGHATNVSLAFTTGSEIVVGLMDAETQGRPASSVELSYALPSTTGAISQQLVPFLSFGGDYAFSARYSGWSPLVLIAGVGISSSQ